VIDFRVLKIRNFMLGTLSMLVLGFVLYASTMLLPLLLQTLLGYTAMLSGLVLSPGGLVVIVCMPLVGTLLRHFQARWLVIFGVLVSASGLVIMSRFNLYIDYGTAVWSRMVQSAGMAFLFVPISVATVAMVPRDRMNYATGLFNLARNIGGSSGIATVTTLLARRSQMHQQVLTAHLTPYDAAYRNAIAHTTQMLHAHGATMPDAARQAGGLLYGGLLRQSAMLAFADAFWVMALLFLLIIPFMFLMKRTGPMRGPLAME
jgi:DHA2 family multidrug resistance protein